MTQSRTVHRARVDLYAAAHDLLDPVVRKVLRDGGHTTEHTAPSLLEQLADAGGHSGETGHSSRSGSRLPIDAGAVDLLVEITTGASDLHDKALDHSQLSPVEHIRAVIALAEQWDDVNAVDWATGWLQHWQRAITNQLDPKRRWHLAEACPVCHVHMASTVDSGDTVLVPALVVDTTTGADCRACGAHWASEQLEQLAADIRAARTADVA